MRLLLTKWCIENEIDVRTLSFSLAYCRKTRFAAAVLCGSSDLTHPIRSYSVPFFDTTARGAGQASMEIEKLVKMRGNICGIVRTRIWIRSSVYHVSDPSPCPRYFRASALILRRRAIAKHAHITTGCGLAARIGRLGRRPMSQNPPIHANASL